MSAGPWKFFNRAKRNLLIGNMVLNAGVLRMSLHRVSASAALAAGLISTFASLTGEISARGGYATGGRTIPGNLVTVGASAKQQKFSYLSAGLVYTASNSALNNIKYAVIRTSTGAGAGRLVVWCTLSTSPFSITSPNTLTIAPQSTGVFTLA